VLLVGDLVGSDRGALVFGPPSFTVDSDANVRSLRRVLEFDPNRILFSHGAEVPNPGRAIVELLEGRGPDRSRAATRTP
jgi:glyoxylase-like metal-dependent hydrolase (beta-lactamase superfamily II)